MTAVFSQKWLGKISKIGALPDDTDELRLQKSLLVISAFFFFAVGIVWGLIYILLGEPLAGAIPLGFTAILLVNLFVFSLTRRFNQFLSVQLLLMLLLPFLVQVILGGFVNASAVVLWSFVSPLSGLLIAGPRSAPRWFGGFLLVILVSGLLDPYLRMTNNLSPAVLRVFFVMNVGAVLGISFILLHYFVGQRDRAYKLLHLEQEKSEKLLLNILPREIAAILKNENRTIAERFEAASILFADLQGFTPLSARLTPEEAVDLLNEIYSYLDLLVEKYGLEKIRTIGDNYMVAAGVPPPRADHAQALANMALEICAYMQSRAGSGDAPLQFRVGINSGPLVAGVIGRKKFHYDVWGDTVNTASRMESHGTPGRVQVTRATYELLRDDFLFEPRGRLDIKGKGEMETWFLVGRK